MKTTAVALGLLVWVLIGSVALSGQESPEFLDAMDEAEELMEQRDYKEAIKAYRKADRLSAGRSFACKHGMAKAFNRIGAYKNSEDCARQALELAQEPKEFAAAWNQLGESFFESGSDDPSNLGQAAEAFQKVLDLEPEEGNIARFNLGVTLLKLQRDEEGIAMLEEFLERDPTGREATQARSFLRNPLRARVPMIPEFEIVTLDGEYLTSEDLIGKVVLFDFWGTWCPPCVRAIPHLRSLNKKMSGEPFTILSVSSDSDEDLVRDFVTENRIAWPQFVDERGELIGHFQIRTYPTYVVADPNGVILYLRSGWSSQIEGEVGREIRKALKAVRLAAKAD